MIIGHGSLANGGALRNVLSMVFALVALTASGCRDRASGGDETPRETAVTAAQKVEATDTTALATDITAFGAESAATSTDTATLATDIAALAAAAASSGPNCTPSGAPTLGVNIGYNCTGALAAATFTRALCACGTIQGSNSLTTDGFDSSNGGPTGGLGGDVAANAGISWSTTSSIGGTLWTPGNLTSSNPSTVRANLYLGGTLSGSGTFTVNGNAYVVKTLPSFARVLGKTNKVASVATPCNCSNLVPIANITAAHRAPNNDDATINLSPTAYVGNNPTTLDLPCGNYYLTQINAAQPLTIKVHGHAALHVDGNLQASQNLTFQFDTGATLDLFVAGTFYAAQTLTLGSPTRPENCRLFVAGTSFVTSGNAAYGCNVYAPKALITLANNTVVSGSIFANNIQVSGNATVHFDTSITGAGNECCTAALCDDGNPCTVDSCNANGTCAHSTAANGTACSDGNGCTQTDTCQAGICTGTNPVVCAPSDQCHAAGTCNSATGACSNPAKADGTACNDGNSCTQSDSCLAGACAGANPVACAAVDQCHDAGTCDPTSGQCSNPAKANGTSCNDGDSCSQTDSCQAGTCTGSNPVVCAAPDQCHDAGTCNSSTGQCAHPAKANGTACNDGNSCTQTDSCQAGTCTGSSLVVCSASDQCHDAGTCDSMSGLCTNPERTNGTACNDGSACTQADSCQAGVCTGSNAVTCVAGDQCHDAGTCDPISGQCSNPAKTNGATCNDGNSCTQTDTCQVGNCIGQNPVTCLASDVCHEAGVCEPATGTCSNPVKPMCEGGLPPEPSLVAPALDRTVANSIYDQTRFLYEGTKPIQTGVATGAIKLECVAEFRGRVLDELDEPLSGVSVSVVRHPEFGKTLTRLDGRFDMAVTGGGPLTIEYATAGYLPVRRTINTPCQEFVSAPEIVMIPVDSRVTQIEPDSLTYQIAQGNVVTDADGIRQGTVLFAPGTQALAVGADCSTTQLSELSVRITEYTVGSDGDKRMPAELPPDSAYTYAFEVNADQATALGAARIDFSQPVIYYVDNFLGFPAGTDVPVGTYDRACCCGGSTGCGWAPANNGKVVNILSIAGGMAQLDTTGDGIADTETVLTALGITDGERQQLATLYQPGQSIWRANLAHFSTWDLNWGFSPPANAIAPNGGGILGDVTATCRKDVGGSEIDAMSQTVAQREPIIGTPYELVYQSDRVAGRTAGRTIDIPLSGTSLPSSAKRIELEIEVAGKQYTETFAPSPNLSRQFTWDGRDVFGRQPQGAQPIHVRIGYAYDGTYEQVAKFGYMGNGTPITGSKTRRELTLWRDTTVRPKNFDVQPFGLGGWNIDVHHAYDPSGALYLGNGKMRSVDSLPITVNAFAGGGTITAATGVEALKATFGAVDDIAIAPDGSAYVIDHSAPAIYRIADGVLTRVAGTGIAGYNGDEIPAIQAQIDPYMGHIAIAPECKGGFYFVDSNNYRVRHVDGNGIIHTIAGRDGRCPRPYCMPISGNPATQEHLLEPWGIAVGPDGNIYYSDLYGWVGRIGADGILTVVAGTWWGDPTDGVPATQSVISPSAIEIAPDGTLYILDDGRTADHVGKLRRVRSDGIIDTVAGGGTAPLQDGAPAKSVNIYTLSDMALGRDGTIYFSLGNSQIWAVTPDGLMRKVAGGGTGKLGSPAQAASLPGLERLGIAADDTLYLTASYRYLRLTSPFPRLGPTQHVIPSEDGREVFVFNASGRHLKTIDALTSTDRYVFGYDSAGRLTSIADTVGNVTTIHHDPTGNPTSIVGPYGQSTLLASDSRGFLASIVNPANESIALTYFEDRPGLLATYTDARGSASRFTYDNVGRLTRQQDASGGGRSLSQVATSSQRVVSQVSAAGVTSSYTLDTTVPGSEARTNTLPGGATAIQVSKSDGTVTTTLPSGTTSTLTRGPEPRFGMAAPIVTSLQVQSPAGLLYRQTLERTATLTDPFNVLSLATLTDSVNIDPLGSSPRYTTYYDSSTRTFTMTAPSYRSWSITMDARGRLASTQRASMQAATFSYDTRGRLASISQSGRSRSFGYDSAGMLSTVTDPLAQVTAYVRDNAGRVTAQTLADGESIGWSYDAGGNLASMTPPGRLAHVFEHSALGRLQMVGEPVVQGSGTATTQFGYDPDGRLANVTKPDGSVIGLDYDSASRIAAARLPVGMLTFSYGATTGRLTSATGPDTEQLSYGYDGVLARSETWSGPVSGQITWRHDRFQKPISESVNGANVVSYAYDSDGLVTKAGLLTVSPSGTTGLVAGTALRGVTDSVGYDGVGQRSSYTANYLTSLLFGTTYTRDSLGRILTVSETLSGETHVYAYGYDVRNRLTDVTRDGAPIAHYAYDPNSNRTLVAVAGTTDSATYDAQDRLLSQGTVSFAYGANGELQTKTDSTTGAITRYAYDALGNLTRVELADGRVIDYLVDAAGRRIAKRINGITVRQWLYHNALKPAAEFDGSGNLMSRLVYADVAIGDDAADQILMERLGMSRSSRSSLVDRTRPMYLVRGSKTLRILTDHLGSPRLVVDVDSGQIAQQLEYDAWGAVQSSTADGFQPFGFAGGLYDPDTKLVRLGARDYDPQVGRWLAKEPMKTAGALNLYEYAGSDPVNNIDVDGLAKVDCSSSHQVECQNKALLLDSLCGPDAQGELRCTMHDVASSAEQAVSALGAAGFVDTDSTAAGVAASGNWGDFGSGVPSLSIGGGMSTGGGDAVGVGSGAAVANQPAVVSVTSGTNIRLELPTNSASLSATATDDGIPSGYGISSLWYTSSGPNDAIFGSPNTPATTVTFPVPGVYTLTLAVTDGELMTTAVVTATVVPQNFAPVVAVSGPAQVVLVNSAHLLGTVTDDGLPAGSSLTYAWSVVSGPGTVTFAAPNQLNTDASFSGAGAYVLQLSASDGQHTATAELTVRAVPPNDAPVVNAGVDQTLTPPNKGTILVGIATDDGLPDGSTLTHAWSQVSGPALANIAAPSALQTAVTFAYPGSYVLRLTATDGTLTTSDDVLVTVGATSGNAPIVQIVAPSDDARVTEPAPVTGSVTEGDWALTYRLGGRDDVDTPWRTLASGSGSASGALATLDPTLLLNGIYTLRLVSATTTGQAEASVSVTVDGRMKVGNFTLTFKDLEIPVGGVPFLLTRTYDSRDSRVSDFGAGWSLGLRNVRIEKSGKTGAHWIQTYIEDPFFPQFCLEPSRSAMVSVTMPSGRVYRFRPVSVPHCQVLHPLYTADIGWENVSDPNSPTIALASMNQTSVFVMGPSVGAMQVVNSDTSIYDPRQFTLTTEDGTLYDVDQDRGLTRMEDRSGDFIQVLDEGILHSSGKSVLFDRDASKRITRITDPSGAVMSYDYDVRGDLVTYTDRESYRSRFTYSKGHYLETIQDPLGRTPIRNEYDTSGRLVKVTDASGHAVNYTHDVNHHEERVEDRLGHVTLYEYSTLGDILRKTDPTGAVWSYTYDANGNPLTSTDPLGHTTTKTFNWHNDLLTETNALGETTTRTYNEYSQLLSTTDPLGHRATNEYEATGHLLRTVDVRNNVATNSYDRWGNRLTETDPLGNVTRYEYDNSRNVTRKFDALNHVTTFTYDSDNRKASETVTRVVNGATETLVTSYTYDKNGRVVRTTFPDGSSVAEEWDGAGKRTASIDSLGHRTVYGYDALDRLSTTTYPDGSTETIGYDYEGRRASRTNALGNTTSYAYDVVGRLTTTTNPDGSTSTNTYDPSGKVIGVTDEAGKTTTFGYDLAGRRSSATDPRGATTSHVFDAAGREIELHAPDGSVTEYDYDAAGQLIETRAADAAATLAEFDELGRQVSKTDELGRTTLYGYDELGRLTSVRDAANQVTRYGYDEQANQISQTDANGHVTHFAYDNRGRMIQRQLPDGTSEHKTYDVAGRLLTKTDFAGRTTSFTYDNAGRELTRRYPDATTVTSTYDAAGARRTVTDSRGTTTYSYDQRGRVTTLLYPDGRELDYGYDLRGPRNTLTARIGTSVLTTTTAYDDAGHLASLTDPLGRSFTAQHNALGLRSSLTYPNGLETQYGYDNRGRLTSLVTKAAGPSGTTTQSYTYTLDSVGKRTRIAEADGTVRQYGYDSVDRLTSESVNGALTYGNAFTYDPVGNRATQVTTGSHPGTVSYRYDSLDRLRAEGASIYGYDSNGNLTTKSGEATYSWDFENRLSRVALQDGSSVEHLYDADGNRVKTTVTPTGGGTPTVTNYLVDTTGSLSQVVAETDASGAISALFVRADNELLAVLRPATTNGWTTRYVHVDGLGSIRVLTDETGVITDTRDYEAFGVMNEHAGADALTYGFAGEAYDARSQLAYHRARWMDARTGRFLGMDPGAGDWHRPYTLRPFQFAGANPLTRVDPSGWDDMVSISAAGVGAGVLATLPNAQPMLNAAQAEASMIASEGTALLAEEAAMFEGELSELVPEVTESATAAAHRLGVEGEAIAKAITGLAKNTKAFDSFFATGKSRIPDFLDRGGNLIGEVKNVARLDYRSQLKDFVEFARVNDYSFHLWVRDANTKLAPKLLELRDQGKIFVHYLYE